MKIEIRKSAIKDLKHISEPFKTKIHNQLLSLKDFPNLKNIKKLTNFEPAYRLRVGNYRILFDVLDDVIIIGRVLHRKNSYQ
ncbi:MAG: type II toxin-antitoxin system RelE/ParE family toxin [Poseidonibacter sp.]|uniref:type II toxin-antitoxin system RelE family toxin n=1 Tax=Poseidonibacter sp. TaxID=2321188 RepID=UPI00359E74A0